jgi:O-antigen ligase
VLGIEPSLHEPESCVLPAYATPYIAVVSLWGVLRVKHITFLEVYSLIKLLELIVLVSLVRKLCSTAWNIRVSLWILYISGVFQAILGIWQFHVQHGVGLALFGEYIAPLGTGGLAMLNTSAGQILRAYGTFPHPNVLAGFLAIALTIGYLFVSRETVVKRRIWLEMGNFLLILGVFLTFSRVAWVIVACATAIYVLSNLKSNPKRAGTIVFVAIVSCGTILGLWHNLLFSRISNIASSNSYIDRGVYNHWGLEIVKKHPVLGTGLGNYIPTAQTLFHVQPWEYQPPHNLYIYIGASMGLIVLGLFLWFVWKVFVSVWVVERSDVRLTLLVIGFSLLFMSLFDHFLVTIQQGQLLFFTILGLMLAYPNSSKPLRGGKE